MIRLTPDYQIEQYGIKFRLVKEDDSAFILSLRTDKKLAMFVHETDNDIERQKEWIRQYKKRENAGTEYYFIVSYNNELCGTIRITDIDFVNKVCGSGSLFCAPSAPENIAPLITIIQRNIEFDILGMETEYFDVRVLNKKVNRFHKLFGAEIIRSTDIDNYYVMRKEKFMQTKDMMLKFLI